MPAGAGGEDEQPEAAAGCRGGSGAMVFMHGRLDIVVHEAKDLLNTDSLGSCGVNPLAWCFGKACGSCCGDVSDPYANVYLGPDRVAKTATVNNNLDPVWEEEFLIDVCHDVPDVKFRVQDKDTVGVQWIGMTSVPTEALVGKGTVSGWFDLRAEKGNGKVTKYHLGKIRVSLTYTPVEKDSSLGSPEVPHAYFPLRKGCALSLYQDAHQPDGLLPEIRLPDGSIYPHGQCWRDIEAAILAAEKMVYVAGWSVFTPVVLVRDEPGHMNLGDLLKKKAAQGCRVLMLVWNDSTSVSLPFVRTAGVMAVHDEDTLAHFIGTGVECQLVAREGGPQNSLLKGAAVSSIFTHHQKIVVVDAPGVARVAGSQAAGQKRRLKAFIGGIDLCDGRYDTAEHSLFRTRDSVHKDDFMQHCCTVSQAHGPRQPWHDIHCQLEGGAARDVLQNFEERWRQQAKPKTNMLLELNPALFTITDADEAVTSEGDNDTWHAQLFRSIDERSAAFDPAVKPPAIWRKKGRGVDNSIHKAYVHQIRRARDFIYIENQYFLGSSQFWETPSFIGCSHLIPAEISNKIVSKINRGERFATYINIPMFSEGFPNSDSVQEILWMQRLTMQAMYKAIARALRNNNRANEHPQDYLNFFCLANRETTEGSPILTDKPPAEGAEKALSQSRRFMIYIHSKHMIVDDEYAIVGSANINMRSMAAVRDTEIAVGAFQPHHMGKGQQLGTGAVHGFRLSLWAEHMGAVEDVFQRPGSVECVRRVNALAQENWRKFMAPEVTEMTAHLIPYPMKVEQDGTVRDLDGCSEFPDIGGKIAGASTNLPDILTT
eukprot:jgi/Chlat1/6829/Chrsp51S06519